MSPAMTWLLIAALGAAVTGLLILVGDWIDRRAYERSYSRTAAAAHRDYQTHLDALRAKVTDLREEAALYYEQSDYTDAMAWCRAEAMGDVLALFDEEERA